MITGAGGQLGSLLAAQATRSGRDVLAAASSQWDVTDPAAAARNIQAGDTVINCAAYTDVDGAETDEARAYAVNAAGPEHLARACARVGAELIHVSTDYVFDGDFGDAPPRPYEPGDRTAPQGVYARSKLAGEQAVHAALPDAVVVRTAWVYTGGVERGDFVAVMQRLAAGAGPIRVVDDQTGSPTYAADLAAALLELADSLPTKDVRGRIFHAANEGAVSRFEQARAVFEESGADPHRVNPCGTDEFPRPAARPGYSALSNREWIAAGLTPLRPWRSALTDALAAAGADRPLPSTRD
ncbi:NAD(P)-dependent oxidoreductase [Mycobacterium kiyosense]|uniref:dTDP-4-dehydrorhamnose reductase n=1 Tax=Mycobacterium kiyosense TaxID=2871094 RepID=A0A9P3Q4F7_9MYCO|nr:NAD(P)-dependent oxidoreductase [Mycobacterium kiyosense]BDE12666.1 NAD(P)-dependent oxidoreductase [Mycobacterium sp. 20KCMC460]GLB82606.1 NAD(P)-dependent oxidoreductase [Mycobacterium kiyosense]GLB87887.1 NAD(P)-dependent oxidoreductase [Mycobacterium kiyosense]GLB94045.1 NAD(P)-dependent oxidoreductase [Mycobacterium kiyosense]